MQIIPHANQVLICLLYIQNDQKLLIQYFKVTNTACYIAQKAFDDARDVGEMGHLMQRPSCNGDGDYNPITCIPGQL